MLCRFHSALLYRIKLSNIRARTLIRDILNEKCSALPLYVIARRQVQELTKYSYRYISNEKRSALALYISNHA